MASRVQYQVVGRYMDGKRVTGYHLMSTEKDKSGKYTKEQVAYLVGRGQITNCTGQMIKNKDGWSDFLLRATSGASLDSLPVVNEEGKLSRTDAIGHVRRNTSAADAMTQYKIVGVLTMGKNIAGYVIQNSGGGTKKISRAALLEEAKAGRIGNARVQKYDGKYILKGVNCDLSKLPVIEK